VHTVRKFTSAWPREEEVMLFRLVRTLTIVVVFWCLAGQAWAEDTSVESLGAMAAEAAAHGQSTPPVRKFTDAHLAGLKARLRLRLRFDWIRSYTALGPHLYLARSECSAPSGEPRS
jgi:hypothetical protein